MTATDPQTERLVTELEGLGPYKGWQFSYEYPGYFCYSHDTLPYCVFFTPDWEGDESMPVEVQGLDGYCFSNYSTRLPLPRENRTGQGLLDLVRPTLDMLAGLPVALDLYVWFTDPELEALKKACEHVRVHMAHQHPWAVRDAAMMSLNKVITAAATLHVQLTENDLEALKKAVDHVRVHMAHQHSQEVRDTAMTAIGKVLAAARAEQQA